MSKILQLPTDDEHLDVSYDRSADPKSLTFDDLPTEMVEEILGKLDLKSRLTTRKVCKKLLQINGQMSEKIKRIEIRVEPHQIKIRYNDDDVKYANCIYGSTVTRNEEREVTLPDDYATRAMDDLKIVLEIPKVEIQKLTINYRRNSTRKVLQLLQKIHEEGCAFRVEKARIDAGCFESALEILGLFKSGVLKNIDLNMDNGPKARNISQLQIMEQFKKAKEIDLQSFATIESCLIFNHFQHFETFHIRVHSMITDHIVQLRDMLLGSAHFQECSIHIGKRLTPIDYQAIRGALGEPEVVDERRRQLLCHMRIPNSDGAYLELKIRVNAILVTRHAEKPKVAPEIERPRFFRARESSSSSSSSSSSDSD